MRCARKLPLPPCASSSRYLCVKNSRPCAVKYPNNISQKTFRRAVVNKVSMLKVLRVYLFAFQFSRKLRLYVVRSLCDFDGDLRTVELESDLIVVNVSNLVVVEHESLRPFPPSFHCRWESVAAIWRDARHAVKSDWPRLGAIIHERQTQCSFGLRGKRKRELLQTKCVRFQQITFPANSSRHLRQ